MSMKITAETDTGIDKVFFVSPEWDKENQYLVIRCDISALKYCHLQLAEWVRQIEQVMENLNIDRAF